MRLKTLLTVTSIVAFVNGISYLFAPAATMTSFGFATNEAGLLLARYFGASTLGVAVLSWLGRRIDAPQARRVLVATLLVTFIFYTGVDLLGVLSGVMNVLGWTFVATDLLIALGYAYIMFVRPGAGP